jgi:hypothetical protein
VLTRGKNDIDIWLPVNMATGSYFDSNRTITEKIQIEAASVFGCSVN